MRACSVGITNGWPSWAKPRCATSASSRMAVDGVAVVRAFSWTRRTRTRSDGAAVRRRERRGSSRRGRIAGRSGPASRAIDAAVATGPMMCRLRTATDATPRRTARRRPGELLVALDPDARRAAAAPARRRAARRDPRRAGCAPACGCPPRARSPRSSASRAAWSPTPTSSSPPRAGSPRGAARARSSPPRPPPSRRRAEPPRRAAVRFDFTPTTPDVSLFPRRQWARAVARAAAEAPDAELDYGSGLGSLRAARGARRLPRPRARHRAPTPATSSSAPATARRSRLLFARARRRAACAASRFEDPSLRRPLGGGRARRARGRAGPARRRRPARRRARAPRAPTPSWSRPATSSRPAR